MRVFVSQFYIEPEARYPFSHLFQRALTQELTERVSPSKCFMEKYGDDFDVIFRMSAKVAIKAPEVRGPTVFRRDKDVEFTIFLPFNASDVMSPNHLSRVICVLLEEIAKVLESFEIDCTAIRKDMSAIADRIVIDSTMFRAL